MGTDWDPDTELVILEPTVSYSEERPFGGQVSVKLRIGVLFVWTSRGLL